MTSEVDASVENSKFEKRKSRKRKSARSLPLMLTEKKDFEASNKKEFRLLWEALDSQNEEDKQGDVIPLPPTNQENSDTDNKIGDKNNLNEISLNQVVEVAGTVKIQTPKQLSKM